MIAVLLHYRVDAATIDLQRPAHLAWLRAGRDAGMLLMSARRIPVTGGMLLVRSSMQAARAWAAGDPFAVHGLADYEFVELEPSLTAPGLEALMGGAPR